jgi:hypothetical protein
MNKKHTEAKPTAARRCVSDFVGRLLCRIGLHQWYPTACHGLGTVTYYRCSACKITGNSHVTDDGEIFYDEPNKLPDCETKGL